MKYIGIARNSNKYKGNIHSHTTNSDGILTPAESKAYYKEHGYSFIAFTDHDIYTDYTKELNDDDFIILPGIEASLNLISTQGDMAGKRIKTHHFLGLLGTEEMQKNASKALYKNMEQITPICKQDSWDIATAQSLVNEMHARGLAVTYNHPLWSRVDLEEFAGLENIFALEVYNYGTEIECALGSAFCHWDEMLKKGVKIHGFACDDNHNFEKLPDSFGGAIVVCAEKLSHEDIMKNMLAGNYYSTSGVDIIEWGIENDKAYVNCSDVRMINFIVGGKVGDGETVFCQNIEDTINFASYSLKGTEQYIRIECVDKYGRKAWTNPYYIK